QPREGQPEAAIRPSEQLGHDRPALALRKLAQDLRGSVRHRGPEAVHLLEMLRRVDCDRFVAFRWTGSLLRGLRRKLPTLVRGRQPHLGWRWFRGAASGEEG